jgi:hypothetical protein
MRVLPPGAWQIRFHREAVLHLHNRKVPVALGESIKQLPPSVTCAFIRHAARPDATCASTTSHMGKRCRARSPRRRRAQAGSRPPQASARAEAESAGSGRGRAWRETLTPPADGSRCGQKPDATYAAPRAEARPHVRSKAVAQNFRRRVDKQPRHHLHGLRAWRAPSRTHRWSPIYSNQTGVDRRTARAACTRRAACSQCRAQSVDARCDIVGAGGGSRAWPN